MLLVGALLVGWFVPNNRYDILAVLLIIVALALGMLFRRLARLQRETERAISFRLRAEETAQAFGNPDWDYAASQWRPSAWTRPAATPTLALPSTVESPQTSSVYA